MHKTLQTKIPHVRKRHSMKKYQQKIAACTDYPEIKSSQRSKYEKNRKKPKNQIKKLKFVPIVQLKRIVKLSKRLWYHFKEHFIKQA